MEGTLNPAEFLQLAEVAAYADANVRFPVLEMSAAEKINDLVYRKEIVKKATITQGGKSIRFDEQFLKDLKQSYDEVIASGKYIPLQFVTDDNKHTDNPKYYGGEITKLELDDEDNPTSLVADFKLEEDARKVVEANPRVGVSISAKYLDLEGDRIVQPKLQHVAITHREKLKGMREWQKIAASLDGENRIDLTDADVTIDIHEGGSTEMTDKPQETPTIDLTQLMESDEFKNALNLAVQEKTAEKDQQIQTLQATVDSLQGQNYEQTVDMAMKSYAQAGVPKKDRELGKALLMSLVDITDDKKLELTEGEGDNAKKVELSRYEAVLALLNERKGTVPMEKERGSSTEPDTDELNMTEDERKKAIEALNRMVINV